MGLRNELLASVCHNPIRECEKISWQVSPYGLTYKAFANRTYSAVGIGAGAQFRMIGSAMILAISTSVFNGYTRPQLQALLGTSDTNALTQLASLPQALQEEVRYALSEAYNRQNIVLCISAAMQIPASLLMWKRKQVVI